MAHQTAGQGGRAGPEWLDRLTRELQEERAAALRRISSRLESLIGQLHAVRAQIETLSDADRPPAAAAYNELRRKALTQRWFLEVQREALGLRVHHRLDEFYQVPGPLPDTVAQAETSDGE